MYRLEETIDGIGESMEKGRSRIEDLDGELENSLFLYLAGARGSMDS